MVDHLHPHVSELVKLVGRMFYRDEYVVVLDALTHQLSLRDDGLNEYFGLQEKQVRRILNDLKRESMVCWARVSDSKVKKKGSEQKKYVLRED